MHWSHLQQVSDRFLATSQSEDETFRNKIEDILAGRKVTNFEIHNKLLFKVNTNNPAGIKILRLCLSESRREQYAKDYTLTSNIIFQTKH